MRSLRRAIIIAVTICALPALLFAQCLEDGGLLRSSLNCTALPTIDKYYDPAGFRWGGSEYLAVSTGNDIALWRLTDPAAPTPMGESHFGVSHQGDSDHDLVNYSICDDCRWAIATFHLGNMLFDLGTQTTPTFAAKQFYDSTNPRGGFTFEFNGEQYLIANKLPGDCGGDATLYHFSGLTSIDRIGCVDVGSSVPVGIFNGVKIEDDGDTYLYLGFTNYGVYIYQVQPNGSSINIINTAHPPLVAFLGRGKGLAVDHDAKLAVTASYADGLRIYDITTPAAPVLKSVVSGFFTTAAVKFPFAWAARGGSPGTERTFLIEDPGQPEELDPAFWNLDNPWNSHSDECENPNGAVFSSDATTMYLARNAVFQMIDFTDCQPTDVVFSDGFESGTTAAWGEP